MTDNQDQPETETGPQPDNTAMLSSLTEVVPDRVGEIMETAFKQAADHIRTTVGTMADPRDGTKAPFAFGTDGSIDVVDPDAWNGYRQFPLARTGTAKLTQLHSFISLVQRFRDVYSTVIYASDNMAAPSLTAIFDYHPANIDILDEAGDVATPPVQNLAHRATYGFPLSLEWQAWMKMNAEPMSMSNFAAFLEDHIIDVSDDPVDSFSEQARGFISAAGNTKLATQARLIALSRSFRVYETATSVEGRNLTSGEAQLSFQCDHKDADGKPVDFPNLFSIVVPVFARATVYYRLLGRLRYRISNGKAMFWYDLWRPDLTFETAFNDALTEVGRATGAPIYIGSPEQ